MRHKTIVEYEDGHKYRTDDPECTCRKCLLSKLENTKARLKKSQEDLEELCEHPDSENSKSIRRIHYVMSRTAKNYYDTLLFGSVANKPSRGILDMMVNPQSPPIYVENPYINKALDDLMENTKNNIPTHQFGQPAISRLKYNGNNVYFIGLDPSFAKPKKLVSKFPMQSMYLDEEGVVFGYEKFGDKYAWIKYYNAQPSLE